MDLTDSSFMVKEKEAGDVSRFLNRILGLSVEKQNLVSKLLWLYTRRLVLKKTVFLRGRVR